MENPEIEHDGTGTLQSDFRLAHTDYCRKEGLDARLYSWNVLSSRNSRRGAAVARNLLVNANNCSLKADSFVDNWLKSSMRLMKRPSHLYL